MNLRPLDERGLTLTEVTIVAAIGLLVLLGLGGFYLNSQATWLDASTQSITQREATNATEAIAEHARAAGSAIATPSPDADHQQIAFYALGSPNPDWCFWWDATDSLVHHGPNRADDRGAILASKAEILRFTVADHVVQSELRLRSVTGDRVTVASSALMRNHP